MLIRGTLGSASLLSGFNPSGGATGGKFTGTSFASKSGGAKTTLLSGGSSGASAGGGLSGINNFGLGAGAA